MSQRSLSSPPRYLSTGQVPSLYYTLHHTQYTFHITHHTLHITHYIHYTHYTHYIHYIHHMHYIHYIHYIHYTRYTHYTQYRLFTEQCVLFPQKTHPSARVPPCAPVQRQYPFTISPTHARPPLSLHFPSLTIQTNIFTNRVCFTAIFREMRVLHDRHHYYVGN